MRKNLIIALIFVLAAVLVFSCFMIVKEVSRREKEKDDFEKLEELVSSESPEPENENPVEEPEAKPASKRNLAPLFEQNPDCIGWIYIEGTSVDYPVMHTPDEPQRYLRKNFEGEYAMSGVPFLEGTRELSDDNIVIYGHNMLNGTMFSDITLYTSREYFDEHPVIEFETAEGVKLYDIFAVVMLKDIDIWYYFDSALNAEHFDEMISDIKSRSLYETGIYPEYGKQLLTLSTCYGENDEDRIIIIGTEK